MKRISLSVAASAALLISGSAFAQSSCDRPIEVNIPDGASASLDDMLEAQSGVRDYLSDMEEYLECMNDMIDSANEETPPETVNAWINDYNEGVGEMETVAERFNEERVAYQQANPSE
jgi:hypothetical protein